MGSSNYVHIDVDVILGITDKAFLVSIDGEEIWLPASQIFDPEEYEKGDENITLSITQWIAREKGLDE